MQNRSMVLEIQTYRRGHSAISPSGTAGTEVTSVATKRAELRYAPKMQSCNTPEDPHVRDLLSLLDELSGPIFEQTERLRIISRRS